MKKNLILSVLIFLLTVSSAQQPSSSNYIMKKWTFASGNDYSSPPSSTNHIMKEHTIGSISDDQISSSNYGLYPGFIYPDSGTPLDGNGTPEDPYQIADLNDLRYLSEHSILWDKHFIQTANIDANDTQNWNSGEGFSPIGNHEYGHFTGSYDGLNHTIEGLFIYRPASGSIGLFGFTNTCFGLLNIGLTNVEITGNNEVGSLVGRFYYRPDPPIHIDNCYSSGIVNGNDKVAGLIGYNGGHIANSFSHCEVNANNYVGGLVGFNHLNITNSYATGNVSGNTRIGGLAGWQVNYYVTNCYATGSVIGNEEIGGLVGCYNGSGYVFRCFSSGSINSGSTTGTKIGGLIGYGIYAWINDCYSTSSVSGYNSIGSFIGHLDSGSHFSRCYGIGAVNGSLSSGGLIGLNSGNIIYNSFWDINTTGYSTSAGGTGKTTSEMKDIATFTDESTVGLDDSWDFIGYLNDDTGNGDLWSIDGVYNNGYPFLSWEYTTTYNQFVSIPANNQTEYQLPDVNAAFQFTEDHVATQLDVTVTVSNPGIIGDLPDGVESMAAIYWTVTSSAGDVGSYNITFNLGELGGTQYSNTLRFLKRDNSTSEWIDVVADLGATLVYNEPIITIQGLDAFSDFAPAYAEPYSPENVTIEIIGSDVQLCWNEVNGANFYKIYSSENPYAADWGTEIASVSGTSWSETIQGNKKFYYVVASTETVREGVTKSRFIGNNDINSKKSQKHKKSKK